MIPKVSINLLSVLLSLTGAAVAAELVHVHVSDADTWHSL